MRNAAFPAPDMVQAFFDRAALTWDAREKTTPALLEKIVATINPPQGARMLDIACGTGIMFAPLLARSPALLRGIDLSPGMVRQARQKFPHAPALNVTVGDFYTFQETGFGLAMVFNAYPHFIDKARFAAQLRRCLAPGGRFVIAHGASRARINACHVGKPAEPLSTKLLSCEREAARLGGAFCCDIMIDGDDCYILSGTLAAGN